MMYRQTNYKAKMRLLVLGVAMLNPELTAQLDESEVAGSDAAAASAAAEAATSATIARAVADFENGTVSQQVGALMLLGKYTHPQAHATLLRALEQPVAAVRRAAVVSLLEGGNAIVTAGHAHALLGLLDDPDVEIRRHISASLPLLSISLQLGMSQSLVRLPGDPLQAPVLVAKLQAALRDSDASVRRNLLQWVANRPVDRHFDEVIRLAVADTDVPAAILALREAANRLSTTQFFGALDTVAPQVRADPLWQRQLARVLPAHPNRQALLWLLPWLDATDPVLRAEAAIGVLLIDPATWRDTSALNIVLAADLSAESARNASSIVTNMRANGVKGELAAALTAARSESLRTAAWFAWFEAREPEPGDPLLLRLLDEPSATLRQRLLRILSTRPTFLSPDFLAVMADHRDPQVRADALQFINVIPSAWRPALILHLLIDDQLAIRQQALRAAVGNRIPQWISLLAIALSDPEPAMRETARSLVSPRDQTLHQELRRMGVELP
jgi:hypothetical protein